VAARIAYTKTGAFVRLSLLIDEVVPNPEYRKNANALRQAIANTNGLEKAVDLLETALGLQRPLEQKVGLRAQAAIIQEAPRISERRGEVAASRQRNQTDRACAGKAVGTRDP
jgi:hypothetical protein